VRIAVSSARSWAASSSPWEPLPRVVVLPRSFAFFQAIAGPADRETLLVQQFADAADQQDLVMLVIASVARRLTGAAA